MARRVFSREVKVEAGCPVGGSGGGGAQAARGNGGPPDGARDMGREVGSPPGEAFPRHAGKKAAKRGRERRGGPATPPLQGGPGGGRPPLAAAIRGKRATRPSW